MDTMGDNGQALPALSLADIDTTVNGEPRVLDLRLAEVLGFSQVRDIRKLIERHREVLERLDGICATVAQNRGRGRPATEFWLTKKQAVYLCTKAETERAITVTIQIVELFDAVTGGAAHPALAPVLTRADLDAIDRRARRIGQEEEQRARSALTDRALDRLRRGERIDIASLSAARPEEPAALPPPPARTREESMDLALAHLRALPPELRQEGFRLMHAISPQRRPEGAEGRDRGDQLPPRHHRRNPGARGDPHPPDHRRPGGPGRAGGAGMKTILVVQGKGAGWTISAVSSRPTRRSGITRHVVDPRNAPIGREKARAGPACGVSPGENL